MEIKELLRKAQGHNWAADSYIAAFDDNRQMATQVGTGQAAADRVQILYILNNLQSWRGEEARQVKAELKKIASNKG